MRVTKGMTIFDIIKRNFNKYTFYITVGTDEYKVTAFHDTNKPYVSVKGADIKFYIEDIDAITAV